MKLKNILNKVKKYELSECNFSNSCEACKSRKAKLKKELKIKGGGQ